MPPPAPTQRWTLPALAAAAVLSTGLYSADASALALGRVTVQSALGEPLRAEIELPQITAAEAESLRVAPASPEMFRAQGVDYAAAVHGVQVQLQRRGDGSMVLRLRSERPINEPFLDLVIDAGWNAGHIVRTYTLLFDPPALRQPPAAVAAAPQVAPPAARPRTAPEAAPAPRPARAAASAAAPPGGEVTVRSGDTAGQIAQARRPAGISLDQMLVALARANPEAFVQGNVNRLRAGAVLQMPSESEALATPAPEARRIIAAQSRDFNEYRRRLARAAPATRTATPERSASGSVAQAEVRDRPGAEASPDRLTLAKNGAGASQAEEQLAREKQADQDAARVAELSRNIAELNQLGGSSGTAAPAAPAPVQPAGETTPAPDSASPGAIALPADAAPLGDLAGTQPPATGADTPGPAVPGPAAPVAPAAPAATPPVAAPSFFDTLMEEPLMPAAGLAIILLLLGYGGWRAVQKRRSQEEEVDSAFLENPLQPDSFFGSSGGQRVDTAQDDAAASAYSPSQLDAGDADPVAEADVYLAYGRDAQAEEILKEAQRHQPERAAIPAKLAEIHARRHDRRALEAAARRVHELTSGQGEEWARVAELGREADPANPLYQAAQPAPLGAAAALAAGSALVAGTDVGNPEPAGPDADLDIDLEPGPALPELDLDLDFDLDLQPPAPAPQPSTFAAAAAAASAELAAQEAAAEASERPAPAPEPVAEPQRVSEPAAEPVPEPVQAPEVETIDLELPADADGAADGEPQAAPDGDPLALEFPDLDLDLNLEPPAPQPAAGSASTDALDFDLGDFALDLGDSPASATPSAPSGPAQAAQPHAAGDLLPEDPLATKLALAEEFRAIGDDEGARTLIEEVVAEATGDVRARAERLLQELS